MKKKYQVQNDLIIWTVVTLIMIHCLLFSTSSFSIEAAPKKKQLINSAAEINYPPFSIADENGYASGFSVELMRAALKAMGRDVSYKTGIWDEVKKLLEQGKIDALPLVGRSPERENIFDFTVPYITLHGVIVVKKDETSISSLADLKGRKVAVMKGDNTEEFLLREERSIKILSLPTFETALNELSQGLCDAVFMQRLVALRLIQRTGMTDLRIIENPVEEFKQDFCFAVREGDRETLSLLNEGLAIVVANGTLNYLYSKWFGDLQLPSDRLIIVGGDRNYPPFEFIDANGKPAGYNVELVRAIAMDTGLNIDIRLGDWNERRTALENGRVNILQGMYYSPSRNLKFDFSPPHTMCQHVAVVRKGENPAPSSIKELSDKSIVVEQGDILQDFIEENGLEKQITAVSDQEEALKQLSEGKFDCALVSLITANYLINKNKWINLDPGKKSIVTFEYCFAAAQENKDILTRFSEGLKLIESSGEYRRIYNKWLGVYEKEPLSLTVALRYSSIVIIPLIIIMFVVFMWIWTLRRQVTEKTKAVQESLDRFRNIFETSNVGKSITQTDGTININRAFADFLGYTQDELNKKRWQDITPPEDICFTEKILLSLLNGETDAGRIEKRYVHKSGKLLWADVSVTIRRDKDGKPIYFMTTIVDINDKKLMEEALRKSEEYQRAIIACSPVALYSTDTHGKVLSWNISAERIFGWRSDEVIGKILPTIPADSFDEFYYLRDRILAGDSVSDKEILRLKKDGTKIPISLSVTPLRNDRGEIIGILASALNITIQKNALLRIEHLNKVLRAIRSINQLIVREKERRTLINEGCRLLIENRGYLSAAIILTGVRNKPLIWAMEGLSVSASTKLNDFLERGILPKCCEHITEGQIMVLVENRKEMCGNCPITSEFAENQALCSLLIHNNILYGYLIVALEKALVIDEEEMELLKEMAQDFSYALSVMKSKDEQERLHSQLLQAQKMESVGRLAGGVAHDYNNMLGVIMGYTELALEKTDAENPLHDDLNEILRAANRSVDITKQLLAFARKQTVNPKIIDLNDTVEGMLKMLRRLIGEDIDLLWMPGSGLWPVKIDPTQINQILANLCVNARDAISDIGKITIETCNIHIDDDYCTYHQGFIPGDYIILVVSDNGCGMDSKTLEMVFEPFFTTKETGKGTGLGLATVYGIVKQNDGFINVYSEKDKGTTFKIYIPRHGEAVKFTEDTHSEDIPMGNGENILILEDEISILKFSRNMLINLGYNVLETSNPNLALDQAKEFKGKLDLLITDVIMPGMNGRDVAMKLKNEYPNIKVLYMSGYTANVIAHHGVLDAGVHFIQKPFSKRDLAQKVRSVLVS
jgi:PAS domain S-box-containing protein